MFTHLSRLFSNKSRLHGRAQARRCQTRPQVEVLEGRQLLSTTSAITWHYGTYVQRDLFAIDLQSRLAVEYTSDNSGTNSFFLPSGPGQITAVSAGLGAGGNPEVYVLAADHTVWMYNSYAWADLGGWSSEISATRDGHVYAIGSDGKVYLNSDSGNAYTWQWLGAPKVTFTYPDGLRVTQSWVSEISASAGEVFAIGPDHAIYVDYGATAGGWQLVDNSRYFGKLSATQDGQVYALGLDGGLYQESYVFYILNRHVYGYWQKQSFGTPVNGESIISISAATDVNGQDVVYVIDYQSVAYVHGTSGWNFVSSATDEIAGTDYGYYFAVGDNYPWLYVPGWSWHGYQINGYTISLGGTVW